ncbi:MAG: protein translocase subunit SecD [Roseibacillus sp.]
MQQSTVVFLSGLLILGLLFWYLASDAEQRKRNIGTGLILGIILLSVWALMPRTESSGFTAENLAELPNGAPGWEVTAKMIPALDKKGNDIPIGKEALTTGLRTLQKRLVIDGKGAVYTTVPPDLISIKLPNFSKAEAEEVQAQVIALQPVKSLKPGIDLAGGASFTVQVQPKVDEGNGEVTPVTGDAVKQAIKTLESRLNPDGTKDMLIQAQGEDLIIIEMPGVSEEEAAWVRDRITDTSVLELRAVHPNSAQLGPQVAAGKTIVPSYKHYVYNGTNAKGEPTREDLLLSKRNDIKGKHVKNANPNLATAGVIQVDLTSAGGKFMRQLTAPMEKGRDRLAIVLDGVVKSAPTVQATLSKHFIIEGLGSAEECRNLSSTLMNPLENALKILEERTVTARLGAATVSQGIYAGMAGLGLTLIFLMIYYRIAGIIALIGLSVNVLILFGAMAMFEFTFTLPGIAGIILTIGLAVDANVLIYERLREELKEGKSIGAAIQAAYEKAFTAIFDANITTLITAIILFWRASGTVKGFAITLTIGILASMFAALVVTRVVFWWGTRGNLVNKLKFMHLVPAKQINFMSMRKLAFTVSSALIIGSLVFVGVKQERALGIDFAGGALVQFQTDDQIVTEAEAQAAIAGLSLKKLPIIQNESEPPPSNANILSIRCDNDDAEKIVAALREKIELLSLKNDPVFAPVPVPPVDDANPTTAENEDGPKFVDPWKYGSSRDTVEASLGKDFLFNSILALGLGLIGILIYITIRFEFSFAIGAFAALFHDIVICIGIVILFGHELSLIHVGAFLTIAGYSINDTIVVFDRIRESLRLKRGDVEDVMNLAINATLSRTILTSVTTFVAVFVLYIYGGPALKSFAFAIMIGVVVGTYSSIFVASPIVLIWSRMRGSNLRRELLDANLEAQVNPARG